MKIDWKCFTCKASFVVAGGHTIYQPGVSITYFLSVVARDVTKIAFTIATMNDLDVMPGDLVYKNAREKIWCVARHEFGSTLGKVMKITQSLYGLKSSGASW